MFWENYVRLCVDNGISPNGLAKMIGMSSGSVTMWKRGSIPHASSLQKIADYFHVSVNELLGKEDREIVLDKVSEHFASDRTPEFLSLFQRLTKEQQHIVIASMKGILLDQESLPEAAQDEQS